MRYRTVLLATAWLLIPTASAWSQMPDNSALKAKQVEKMKSLAWLDGEWRGEATITMPSGELKIIQTERIGPMLDGGTKVIEGRGYSPDGNLVFNALGIVTYDAFADRYEIHSFNDGRTGIFPLEVTSNGYNWQTPAGPNASIHYVVTYENGVWVESGSYVMKDLPPRKFIEMRLRRVGDTNWPLTAPLGPK